MVSIFKQWLLSQEELNCLRDKMKASGLITV